MRTLLDDAVSWFLESLVYENELRAVVVEGSRAHESEDVKVGDQAPAARRRSTTFHVRPTTDPTT